MSEETGNDARHEGASFDPVPKDPEPAGRQPPYPPEADPDKVGGLTDAVVPGEQTDPDSRLTGGDQAVDPASTEVTPGGGEPPD